MPKSQTPEQLLGAIYQQNIDQAEELTSLRKDIHEVKRQVKYTNGKVAGLMEDKIRREERDKVLSELTPVVVKKETTIEKSVDWKAVAAGIVFALATLGQIYLAMTGGTQ